MFLAISFCLLLSGDSSSSNGWIPHIPPPQSPYSMSLVFSNPSDSPATVTIQPYTVSGTAGTAFNLSLEANQTIQWFAPDLFESEHSHAWVENGGCEVYWSYDLMESVTRQPLFSLHTQSIYAATFDWQSGVEGSFGLAVVNTSELASELELTVHTEDGVRVRNERIAIGSFVKILISEAQMCCADNLLITLSCEQPIAIVAAQRSWSGSATSFFPRHPRNTSQNAASEIVVTDQREIDGGDLL